MHGYPKYRRKLTLQCVISGTHINVSRALTDDFRKMCVCSYPRLSGSYGQLSENALVDPIPDTVLRI